ncbi:MAG TPA: SURF1 family cytochrome oxidase biogenesis protein [Caulobacteraceae bacterium]|jgi:surfeit locus 1 family protein
MDRRFPVGLTLAALVVFVVCGGLGVWQLQRLAWKQVMLRDIAVRQHAPPVPIGPVLASAGAGADVSFTRVTATCLPAPPSLARFQMTTRDSDWIARALSDCALVAPPYDGVVADRGVVVSSRGVANPPPLTLPAPQTIAGVLYAKPEPADAVLAHPAPVVLVAEQETPAAPGVTPQPYDVNAADNLEYVGAYAPTWFGLAGVVACVYAAMLWRRSHPKP